MQAMTLEEEVEPRSVCFLSSLSVRVVVLLATLSLLLLVGLLLLLMLEFRVFRNGTLQTDGRWSCMNSPVCLFMLRTINVSVCPLVAPRTEK